ncbi:hypothetical protein ACFQER_01005 [Halomicroarcula sp. GCM10025894]|uniref:hypothetical protein n=1 Tax=Halomicroarcula sp. GCM10025894 TaxID=3252673 RepID=UPI00361F7C11
MDTPSPVGTPTTDGTQADRDRPEPEAYETVVDITEAGADADGEESIVSTLEDIDTSNTLVRFPKGTYFMDDTWGPKGQSVSGCTGPRRPSRPSRSLRGRCSVSAPTGRSPTSSSAGSPST